MIVNIATSYYKSPYINKINLKMVAISKSIPTLKYCIDIYEPLVPTWEMIKLKHNPDRYADLYYNQILNNLNAFDVVNDLKNSVLLCWEKPNEFCHRHLVADWIKHNTGLIVLELNDTNYKMF